MATLTQEQLFKITHEYDIELLTSIIQELNGELLEINDDHFKSLEHSGMKVKYLLFKLATHQKPAMQIANASTTEEIFNKFYSWYSFRSRLKEEVTNIEQIIANPSTELQEDEIKTLCKEISELCSGHYYGHMSPEGYALIKIFHKYHRKFLEIIRDQIKEKIPSHQYVERGWYPMLSYMLSPIELVEYISILPENLNGNHPSIFMKIEIAKGYLASATTTPHEKEVFLIKLIDVDPIVFLIIEEANDIKKTCLNTQQLIHLCQVITTSTIPDHLHKLLLVKTTRIIHKSNANIEEKLHLYNLIKASIKPDESIHYSIRKFAPEALLDIFSNMHISSDDSWIPYFSRPYSLKIIIDMLRDDQIIPDKKEMLSLIEFCLKQSKYMHIDFFFDNNFLDFFKFTKEELHDLILKDELNNPYFHRTAGKITISSSTEENQKKIDFIKKIFNYEEILQILIARFHGTLEENDDVELDEYIDQTMFMCILDKYYANPQLITTTPEVIKFLYKMFEQSSSEHLYEQYTGKNTIATFERILHHIKHFNKVNAESNGSANPVKEFYNILIECFNPQHSILMTFRSAVKVEDENLNENNQSKRIFNIIKWLIIVSAHFLQTIKNNDLIEAKKSTHEDLLCSIAKFPDAQMRTKLTRSYFAMCNSVEITKYFNNLTNNQSHKSSLLLMLFAQIFYNQPEEYKDKLKNEIIPKIGPTYKNGKSHKIILQTLLEIIESKSLSSQDLIEFIILTLTPLPIYAERASDIEEAKSKISNHLKRNLYACIVVVYGNSEKFDVALTYIVKHKRITSYSISEDSSFEEKKCFEQFISYSDLKASSMIEKSETVLRSNFLLAQLKRQDSLWMILFGLCKMGKISELKSRLCDMSLDEAAASTYLRAFDIQENEETIKCLEDNILSKHDSTALLTYNAKLLEYLKKSGENGESYLIAMQQFIRSILTVRAQDFYLNRYNLTNNRHLQEISALGYNLDLWKRNYKIGLKQYIDQTTYDLNANKRDINYPKFLYNKIVFHTHLPQTEPLNKLHDFLKGDDQLRQTISEEVTRTINASDDSFHNLREYMFISAIIKLYYCNTSDNDQQQSLISEALQFIPLGTNFADDLKTLRHRLQNKVSIDTAKLKDKIADWTLEFTDDYWKLLMMGTDVDGSCQTLHSASFDLNKCLLAYIMSGHVKLVTIVSQDKIVMRSVMRLCIDEENKKPVIHFEDIYSANGSPECLENILLEYAKELCANTLKCDLVMSDSQNLGIDVDPYPNSISVIDLPTHTQEYVDALGRPQEAPYEIPKTMWLFNAHRKSKSADADADAEYLSDKKAITLMNRT